MTTTQKMAIATKTINKANATIGPESMGFKRYMALPNRVAFSLKVAHYTEGLPMNSFSDRISKFFGSLSDDDFRVWVLANC